MPVARTSRLAIGTALITPNAINSAGVVGGGTAPGFYSGASGAGELMTTGGTVKSPAPNGWVAAITDSGLAVTANAGNGSFWTAAYVDNVSGSATTYWGTGNTQVTGAWSAPMAISPSGQYVAGMK